MSGQSKIEWCDSTFNPWIGCTKVGPGCDNCYAEADFDLRKHRVKWGAGQDRSRTSPANWKLPLRWNRAEFAECPGCGWRGEAGDCHAGDPGPACPKCGNDEMHSARRRVFCASLADVFDNEVPREWRHDLFNLIRDTPNLDWLLLTKRPQNIIRMVQDHGCVAGNGTNYLPGNIWLGATTEDQKHLDMNLPHIMRAKEMLGAAVAFLSVEPMLEGINFDCWPVYGPRGEKLLDWVIVGGESGRAARPLRIQWIRDLVKQCAVASLPVLVKQLGQFPLWDGMSGPDERWPANTRHFDTGHGEFQMELRDKKGGDWSEWPDDLKVRQWPTVKA